MDRQSDGTSKAWAMSGWLLLLNDLTPVLTVFCFVVLRSLEHLFPYFQRSPYRRIQQWHNLAHILVTTLLNVGLGAAVYACIEGATVRHWGLLRWLALPEWVAVMVGILAIDFTGYWMHRLYHRHHFFWRFHRMHHSDIEMDSSSTFRFHPLEFVCQTVSFVVVLPLVGVSHTSFVMYFAFALPYFIINHSNLRFPLWYERWVGYVLVTPDWHRVHHHYQRPATNSNYGDIFSFWDRLFGSHLPVADTRSLTFGLEDYRAKEAQTFWAQLKNPFE